MQTHHSPLEVLHAAPSNESKPPTGGFINAKSTPHAPQKHMRSAYIFTYSYRGCAPQQVSVAPPQRGFTWVHPQLLTEPGETTAPRVSYSAK